MTGISTTSMRHVGMNKEAMKEAVLSKLAIGQQYYINSVHDGYENVKVRLVDFSKRFAVFQHQNGTTESFTYSELWRQMMAGTLR